MAIHESGEMYLEAILMLRKELPQVRSIDIANHTGYSKPSVSRAVNLLRQGGYLVMAEDGCLSLTAEGKLAAKKIFERHTVLSEFLALVGVKDEIAAKDACKIEHVVSDETIMAIKRFLEKQ